MRIPLSWVQQFSPLPSSPIEEIGRRFTLGSCEVGSILACIDVELPGLWSQVQLVEVLHINEHPNAEKLFRPTIATAFGEVHLVCGANNLYPGLKTLWAPEGTEIRSGYDGQLFVLKNKEIMGVMSYGMLCSERELSISEAHDGIIDLSEFISQYGGLNREISVGMSFAELLARCLHPSEDLQLQGRKITGIEFILDVDNKSLTHRPDMWGIYGIAREFGAVLPHCQQTENSGELVESLPGQLIPYGSSRFHAVYNQEWQQNCEKLQGTGNSPIALQIESTSSCQAYCALAMEGLQVTESPAWLQKRLRLAGIHVINSVVDISNYVMLELGIPNHIFDCDNLNGERIYVYRLAKEQKFLTLDGQLRQLCVGDTVVADENEPQVIAGIMGGQNSSVSGDTQRILLEVAVWDSHDVRKTSMRLGLRSDSSIRYEKSLDPYSIERSLWRLCQLLQEIHPQAKVCGQLQCYYRDRTKSRNGEATTASQVTALGPEGLEIITSAAQIAQVLGYPVDNEKGEKLVCQIFCNLGFSCQTDAGKIRVQVPSYRCSKDISIEEDLIEEVGRIIGFDNLVSQVPFAEIRPNSLGANSQLLREIRQFLVLNGNAQEVLSYPLLGSKLLELSHWHQYNESLCLARPLKPEQDRMRPSLIPSHLELVGRNAHNNRLGQFCLFELGRSYHMLDSGPEEQQHLLITSYSEKHNPILELRNICERLLRYLGVGGSWQNSWEQLPSTESVMGDDALPENWEGLHPLERLAWCRRGALSSERYLSLVQARIFSLNPVLLYEFKLKGHLAMAWFPLGPVLLPKDEKPARKKRMLEFQPLQRFPTVEFDCTVVVPAQVLGAEVIQALEQRLGNDVQYQRMASLLQKVLLRSIHPAPEPEGSRWLTLQCLFADSNATLQSDEIKQLEDQTVEILRQAGFPLKMKDAS